MLRLLPRGSSLHNPVVFLLWHFGLARLWAVLDSYLFIRVLIRQLC
jgi:hypothetical protein